MKLYYLENLKSSRTTEISIKELMAKPQRPDFENKKEYINWATEEETEHVFFSAVEGISPHVRVSGSNEAIKIHGIVADYDAKMDLEEAKEGILKRRSKDYSPSHMSQTFSGGIRLVWEFEKPVSFFNTKLYKKFVAHFSSHAKISKLLPGLDACIKDETKYYELGTEWFSFDAVLPVDANLLTQMQMEVSKITDAFSDGHPSLPIEAIQNGMEEKYPGDWTNFSFNSRGKCFWIPGAVNTTMAVMHPQGMQFFYDEGGFVPWGDERLLGSSFVRRFQANRIGGSVSGLYFDGKTYYRKRDGSTHNEWLEDGTEVIKRHMEVNFGLSGRSINGIPSEVKQALSHIETHNRVSGVMPMLYSDNSVVHRDGKMYLNNNNCFACKMADEPQKWGENFPVFAEWYPRLLLEDQRKYLDAFIHYSYKSAKDGKPIKLPTLFLVGGTGIGKTLFSTRFMSMLLGGHSVASGYFMGSEPFNENIIRTGLATIDDQEGTTSAQARNKFSAILKKVTANHSISYRKMYKGPIDVLWSGKIIVTCNTDPESMAVIPNMDLSNIDKLLILRCAAGMVDWDFPADMDDRLIEELPYIARYYYDQRVDPSVIGTTRFTIKPYVEPSLLEEARSLSEDSAIEEMIDKWRREYFLFQTDANFWHGNLTELLIHIETLYSGTPGGGRKVLEGVTNKTLGKTLKKLESQGEKWIERGVYHKSKKGFKIWRINEEDL